MSVARTALRAAPPAGAARGLVPPAAGPRPARGRGAAPARRRARRGRRAPSSATGSWPWRTGTFGFRARTSKQRDRLGREALAAARESEAVGGRRPHGDPAGPDAERGGQPGLHLRPHAGDARPLADEDAVRVHELEARLPDGRHRALEEEQGRGALPLGLLGGEEAADVAEPGRAEDRIDECVGDDIAVRVAGEPGLAGELDAADDERRVLGEGVGVDADPDPQPAHPSGSWRAVRASKTVTVS